MKPARPWRTSPLPTGCWLAIGFVAVMGACTQGGAGPASGQDGGRSGGAVSGGGSVSATGGKSSGGAGGAGGGASATGGGGGTSTAGSGSGGVAGQGGGPGGATSSGGQAAGGSATGGRATGGVGGGGTTGTGGRATGGTTATGGQGSGGKNSGGSLGSGGSASGGSSSATGGQGGRATGGALGSGGVASGGATGAGGAATGGTPGTGGRATGGTSGTGGATGTGGTASFRPCPTDGTACKIMPFGDSITDGYGVPGGYRVELFRRAHQAGKNITFVGSQSNGPAQVDGVNFPPNHEGHSGYTIDNAGGRSGIAPLVGTVMPTYKPHIVLLMIGTNDAIDNYQMSQAPARLGALIDSIFTQLPNILLVVAQPIPSQDDALNQRLQSYNSAIPDVVKARADAGKHILVVNMYAVLAANPSYKTALLQDTWHPNADGHALLGARWYEVLAGSL